MFDKPRRASGYAPEAAASVKRTLLLVAAKLGDLMDDVVVVGGMVPYLAVDQSALPEMRRHVGTMDLDLGLSLAIMDSDKYRELSARLRAEGFQPDTNAKGNMVRQRWVHGNGRNAVRVDFLIQSSSQNRLTNIETDLAALNVEGLELAFISPKRVEIEDELSGGGRLARTVQICAPAAFIVLKAMAYKGRGENKDAYDLFYVLRESNLDEVVDDFARLPAGHSTIAKALAIIRDDFVRNDGGRVQVADFLTGGRDPDIEADVLAFTSALSRRLGS